MVCKIWKTWLDSKVGTLGKVRLGQIRKQVLLAKLVVRLETMHKTWKTWLELKIGTFGQIRLDQKIGTFGKVGGQTGNDVQRLENLVRWINRYSWRSFT